MRRAKVRRNFLSFLRDRRGKSARLKEISFNKADANDVTGPEVENEDAQGTDAEPEQIDAEANEDALNDAVPLAEVEKSEAKAAASEDEASVSEDSDTSNEQDAAAEEFAEGVDRAEPGEGKAVQS